MTRWILLLATVGALALMFLAPSPGLVALGVCVFVFGSIATALAFAQARIRSSARPDDYAPPHVTRTTAPPPSADEPPDH